MGESVRASSGTEVILPYELSGIISYELGEKGNTPGLFLIEGYQPEHLTYFYRRIVGLFNLYSREEERQVSREVYAAISCTTSRSGKRALAARLHCVWLELDILKRLTGGRIGKAARVYAAKSDGILLPSRLSDRLKHPSQTDLFGEEETVESLRKGYENNFLRWLADVYPHLSDGS